MNTVLSGDNYGYNLKIFDKECWNIYYHNAVYTKSYKPQEPKWLP